MSLLFHYLRGGDLRLSIPVLILMKMLCLDQRIGAIQSTTLTAIVGGWTTTFCWKGFCGGNWIKPEPTIRVGSYETTSQTKNRGTHIDGFPKRTSILIVASSTSLCLSISRSRRVPSSGKCGFTNTAVHGVSLTFHFPYWCTITHTELRGNPITNVQLHR